MTIDSIINQIHKRSKKRLIIRVKDYKSTYISIAHNQKLIKLSLHKLFLDAPKNIIDCVVDFAIRKDKDAFKEIKKYAHMHFSKVDYSSLLDTSKLNFKGRIYDLNQIYENLNKKYFNGSLDLKITYFETGYRKFSNITFGSYDKVLKLIKINKILDNINVPFYFIYYIVYHEMLHHIVPVTMSEDAKRKVHSKEFKLIEKKFPYYIDAINWKKKVFRKKLGRKLWQDTVNGQI